VLCSVLPASTSRESGTEPAPKIDALNVWIKSYSAAKATFMWTSIRRCRRRDGLPSRLSDDGCIRCGWLCGDGAAGRAGIEKRWRGNRPGSESICAQSSYLEGIRVRSALPDGQTRVILRFPGRGPRPRAQAIAKQSKSPTIEQLQERSV